MLRAVENGENGGFKHFLFSISYIIWDVILPIDELIFFRGLGIPPTSNVRIPGFNIHQWPIFNASGCPI